MKFNLNIPLKKFGKDPIQYKEGQEFLLKDACSIALFAEIKEERLTWEEGEARYLLAKKIEEDVIVDLTIEQLNMLKQLIGRTFQTIVVGAASEAFEKAIILGETIDGDSAKS